MAQSVHVCSECGNESAKWHGRCPGCDEWNTLVEERAAPARPGKRRVAGGRAREPPARSPSPRSRRAPISADTGIGEFDRVLGGGLVPGSVVLLGGAPGIGKSTLTADALGKLAAAGRRFST